jgi:hypothetical protein
MPQNLSQKLINSHLVDCGVTEGTPITLKIDQTLTQDSTGTFREAPACRHAPLCVMFDRRHVSYRPSGSWARPRLRSRANGPRLFCSGCPNSVGPRVAMSRSSIAGQGVAASVTPRSPRSSSGSKLMSHDRSYVVPLVRDHLRYEIRRALGAAEAGREGFRFFSTGLFSASFSAASLASRSSFNRAVFARTASPSAI